MSALNGLGVLVRLALRRDRIVIPAWVTLFVVMAWSSAAATAQLYPDEAARVIAADAVNSTPVLVALYGKIYDTTSLGAIAMIKQIGLGAAMVGVLSIMIMVRHTRADEEAGRLELVSAGVVGRYAGLAAALTVTGLMNLVLGVLTAASLVIAGLPVAGSVAFGLAWALVGLAFAGVAAVLAQLATNARSASGISIAVLGALYVVRALGDTAGSEGARWLTWLTPLGWQQLARPYADERWWLFALLAAFAVVCSAGAVVLASRRDLGAGLLPDRPGPARAGFGSALGLAWRLQRGALLWWSVAFILLGGVLGAIVTSIGDMLDSPQLREVIEALGGEKVLSEAFLAAEMGMIGVLASAYGIQGAARLRSEEEGLRAEPILAGAVGRRQWVWSHTLVALLGTAVLLVASGLAAGSAYAWTVRDADQVAPVVGAALVQVPAAWVMTALVVAAFGWRASGAIVGWLALVAFMLLAELGPLLDLDQWVMDLSPFAHVPQLPGAEFTATPLVWLVAFAAALLATGLAGIRRRDIA
jgi:ABC-2 type transport system permease protein